MKGVDVTAAEELAMFRAMTATCAKWRTFFSQDAISARLEGKQLLQDLDETTETSPVTGTGTRTDALPAPPLLPECIVCGQHLLEIDSVCKCAVRTKAIHTECGTEKDGQLCCSEQCGEMA